MYSTNLPRKSSISIRNRSASFSTKSLPDARLTGLAGEKTIELSKVFNYVNITGLSPGQLYMVQACYVYSSNIYGKENCFTQHSTQIGRWLKNGFFERTFIGQMLVSGCKKIPLMDNAEFLRMLSYRFITFSIEILTKTIVTLFHEIFCVLFSFTVSSLYHICCIMLSGEAVPYFPHTFLLYHPRSGFQLQNLLPLKRRCYRRTSV